MKRPLWLIGTVMLLAIVVSFLFLPEKSILISLAVSLTGVFLLVLKKEKLKPFIIILFSVAIGFALGYYNNLVKISPFEEYKGETILVEGLVEESKSYSGSSRRYTVWARFPETNLPDSYIIIRDYIGAELEPSDSISAEIQFNDPKYESTSEYYLREGIPGEGILINFNKVDKNPKDNFKSFFIKIRQSIKLKVNSVLSKDTSALVNAMVFGMTEDLDPQLYNNLNRSGTSHLLSVSGFHLSIFTGFILLMLGITGINFKLQNLIAILASVGFAFLVGFSPPVIRSLIMTILFLFARIIDKENDSVSSLGFSAIVIAVLKPVWALSLGLWLSYLATTGIVTIGLKLSKHLREKHSRPDKKMYNKLVAIITGSLSISIGAYIFTLPVLIFAFGWVSLVSPVANLLVSPFSVIIVIVGILIVVLPSWFPLYPILTFSLEFSTAMITQISEILAKLRFSIFSLDHWAILLGVIIVLAVTCICLIFKPQQNIKTPLILICILIFLVSNVVSVIDESHKVQLVQLEEQTLLIKDKSAVIFGTPDTYSVENLIKYLDYRNIDTIDILVMTDYPETPISSIVRLQNNYEIKSVIGPDDAYILNTMSEIIPGVRIYSSGYANVNFFGNSTISFEKESSRINITTGKQKIIISNNKYDIIGEKDKNTIYIHPDDTIVKPKGIDFCAEPLGEMIYNERKIFIPV